MIVKLFESENLKTFASFNQANKHIAYFLTLNFMSSDFKKKSLTKG